MNLSKNYFFYFFLITVLILALFATLQHLNIPAGTFVDWLIGLGTFWWLMGITTIPWNMYFAAREVLDEAAISSSKGIPVNAANVAYARKLSGRFLTIAVTLHIVSAVALYFLAYFHITAVGYFAAIAALLLTFARPLSRLYDYIATRLQRMRTEIRYPRDDVYEWTVKTTNLEARTEHLETYFNPEDPGAWVNKQQESITQLKDKITALAVELDQLRLTNQKEHERLSRKSEEEIARLSEDAQFLNQIRELIRFIKKA